MQTIIQKFRQSSIAFEKPVFCLKIWKLWRAPTILEVNIFAETLNMFSTYHCLQKGVWDFFLFYQILNYLQKLKKTWFVHTRFLHFY